MAWTRSSSHRAAIVDCLDRNAEEMRRLFGFFFPTIVIASGMVLSSVLWALIVSWNLTLVALACAPVVMVVIKWSLRVSGEWEMRCNKAFETASSVFCDIIANIRVVRAPDQGEVLHRRARDIRAAGFPPRPVPGLAHRRGLMARPSRCRNG